MQNYSDKERTNALKRAKQFEKLFGKDNFDAIMNTLYPKKDEAAFRKACKDTAKLVPEDIDWLWNYLRNIDVKIPHPPHADKPYYWREAPEAPDAAAATGW